MLKVSDKQNLKNSNMTVGINWDGTIVVEGQNEYAHIHPTDLKVGLHNRSVPLSSEQVDQIKGILENWNGTVLDKGAIKIQ